MNGVYVKHFFCSSIVLALATSGCGLIDGIGGGGGPVSNGTWTTVVPTQDPNIVPSQVTGLWFDSTSNGDVSFLEGLVEHFDGPEHIGAIALNGHAALPSGGDDGYVGLQQSSLGLLAISANTGNGIVTSTDHGVSFEYGALYGQDTVPASVQGQIQLEGVGVPLPLFWVGADKSGVWHAVDSQDGVWSSPMPPGASATFNLDWHPEGDIPVPNPLPGGDCTWFTGNSYFAGVPGQVFAVTPDGSTMVYGTGGETGSDPQLCRSTDGGKSFVPVTPAGFNSAYYPWIIQFTSNTHGIAAYGSEDSGGAYVYTTDDAGATWTQGTLPPSGSGLVSLISSFASPSGTLFLVGGAVPADSSVYALLLYKSTDGGKTWTDLSPELTGLAASNASEVTRLTTGFALDDNNIWIGGTNGFIAYSSTGGA